MDPYMDEEANNNSGRRRQIDDDDDEEEEEEEEEGEEAAGYRSKNLDAERRRRRRINDGLLELRALVPIITNMKKATIISDAIAYIEQLQTYVGDLSTQLLEMGAAFTEESKDGPMDAIDAAEETTMKWGIEPEVKVGKIEKNKVWIKLVCEKKRRGFSKLMEALSVAGYAFTDITLTTFQTAILVTASLTACHGGLVEAEQIRLLLQEIARSIQSSKE